MRSLSSAYGRAVRLVSLLAWLCHPQCLPAQDQPPRALQEEIAADLRQGRLVEAETALRAILSEHPRDAASLGLLAAILDQQGKHAEAQGYYERALAAGPASVWLLNNFGNHYLAAGETNRAREQYLHVLALEPRHRNANLQLARIAVEGRNGAEALRCLGRLGGPPAEAVVELLRAQALHWAGDSKAALVLFDRIETEAAGDPQALFSVGMALVQTEHYERAENAFSKVLQIAPADFDTLHNLGVAAARAGHPERAQVALEAALRQQPDDVSTLAELGKLFAARKEFGRAAVLLDRAAKLAPARPDIALVLAQALNDGGYYGDSALAYDRYVSLRPDDDTARRERAFVYGRTGQRIDEAVAEMQWYLRKHPRDPVGHYEFAFTLAVRDRQLALEHLATAVKLKAGYAAALYLRAGIFLQLGNAADALQDLLAVAKQYPDNVRALDQLGLIYLTLDRPRDAEGVLRRAASLAPDDHVVLTHLGRALMASGREAEAKAVLDKSAKSSPPKRRSARAPVLLELLSLSLSEQRARALKSLRLAVARRPEDAGARLLLGEALLDESAAGEAPQVFRELLEMAPDARTAAEAGKALLLHRQYNLARSFLERAVAGQPAAYLDLALATYHSEGPQAALSVAESVPEAQRGGDYYLLLAQILDELGRRSPAFEALERAGRLAVTRTDLTVEAALLLLRRHEDQRALGLLEHAERTLPGQPELLLARAVVLELLGKPAAASPLLKRLQGAWPEWDLPYFLEGAMLVSNSRYSEARQLLETAVALGGRSAELYYCLAEAIAGADPGHPETAYDAVSTSLSLRPDYARARALAGRLLFEQGRLDTALEQLRESIRLDGNLAHTHEILARVYAKAGSEPESRTELAIAERLRDHGAPEVPRLLRELLLAPSVWATE